VCVCKAIAYPACFPRNVRMREFEATGSGRKTKPSIMSFKPTTALPSTHALGAPARSVVVEAALGASVEMSATERAWTKRRVRGARKAGGKPEAGESGEGVEYPWPLLVGGPAERSSLSTHDRSDSAFRPSRVICSFLVRWPGCLIDAHVPVAARIDVTCTVSNISLEVLTSKAAKRFELPRSFGGTQMNRRRSESSS